MKHNGVFRAIATAKMELFVALVINFQPLTNFTKKPNIASSYGSPKCASRIL